MSEVPDLPLAKARALLETAKRTRLLHLGSLALRSIPADTWSLGSILIRLDLSFNRLVSLGPEISSMTALEQLWLNDNPYFAGLPKDIQLCKKLKVVDLRRTAVRSLPREFGRLRELIEVDLRETPMARGLGPGPGSSGDVFDTDQLVERLFEVDKREELRLDLLERVVHGVYREDAHSGEGRRRIPVFVQEVCDSFPDLEDLKNVVRNCDRLFPPFKMIARARAAAKVKARCVGLVRESTKTKLSADLELKLRAIYYDVIEPESVEGTIKAIYTGNWDVERPLELEDVQFLIKNAARLFPADPNQITGPGVRAAVWNLQNDLIQERQAVVDKLSTALSNSLYPDRDPKAVANLAKEVGKLLERDRFATKRELEDMKKLAADAAMHFPPDFATALADVGAVKASFKRASNQHANTGPI